MACFEKELSKLVFGPRPGRCTVYHQVPFNRHPRGHTIIYVPSQKPAPSRGRTPTILI